LAISRNVSRPAVVDIGSNSVRMVIFDGAERCLAPLYNEKAMSGLGRNLLSTGCLDPAGSGSALLALKRFRKVADDLCVTSLRAVATAAVRDASDGTVFIKNAEQALGQKIEVLSGEQEARLSALGVISGIPNADGVVGDLGGGSLEIADIRAEEVYSVKSLPIGPLALGQIVGGPEEQVQIARSMSAIADGIASNRALYLVGGAWRSLAKYHFEQTKYPIKIIHQYEISCAEALKLSNKVGNLQPKQTNQLKGISSRRRSMAPYSARLLSALLQKVLPEKVIFSGFGLREGVLFEDLISDARNSDPLIDHCIKLGLAGARIPFDGFQIAQWVKNVFPETVVDFRMVQAAAWLSDMSGHDHPDYRGHNAAARTLTLTAGGMTHIDRAFLAAVVYARYHGYGIKSGLGPAIELLNPETRAIASALGFAFRLAHAIGVSSNYKKSRSLLDETHLRQAGETLFLIVGDKAEMLGETATRRFKNLAEALGLESKIVENYSAKA
jgi:exopolyphosphatase/guanosine-5'-triphosphate,3'-diphosphate pyrophosphatase